MLTTSPIWFEFFELVYEIFDTFLETFCIFSLPLQIPQNSSEYHSTNNHFYSKRTNRPIRLYSELIPSLILNTFIWISVHMNLLRIAFLMHKILKTGYTRVYIAIQLQFKAITGLFCVNYRPNGKSIPNYFSQSAFSYKRKILHSPLANNLYIPLIQPLYFLLTAINVPCNHKHNSNNSCKCRN